MNPTIGPHNWRTNESLDTRRCHNCGTNINHLRPQARWCSKACTEQGHRIGTRRRINRGYIPSVPGDTNR